MDHSQYLLCLLVLFFYFSLFFSFCVYVGPPLLLLVFLLAVVALIVVLSATLQLVGFQLAGFPSTELLLCQDLPTVFLGWGLQLAEYLLLMKMVVSFVGEVLKLVVVKEMENGLGLIDWSEGHLSTWDLRLMLASW